MPSLVVQVIPGQSCRTIYLKCVLKSQSSLTNTRNPNEACSCGFSIACTPTILVYSANSRAGTRCCCRSHWGRYRRPHRHRGDRFSVVAMDDEDGRTVSFPDERKSHRTEPLRWDRYGPKPETRNSF